MPLTAALRASLVIGALVAAGPLAVAPASAAEPARGPDEALTPGRFWFQDRRIHENPRFTADYEYVGSRFVHTAGYLSLYRRRNPA